MENPWFPKTKGSTIYKWFVFQIYANLHEGSHPKTEMSRGPTVVAMQGPT